MKKFNELAFPTLALFLICFVSTFLLGMTNEITAPRIEKLAAEKEMESRKEVFPEAAGFGEEIKTENGTSVVDALDAQGNVIGKVVVNREKGYGGDITVMTGVTSGGEVAGVNVLSHNETPGLGANSTSRDFRDRFIGLVKGVAVSKDRAGKNSIDALTGATITSRAVVEAVNAAIEISGGDNVG